MSTHRTATVATDSPKAVPVPRILGVLAVRPVLILVLGGALLLTGTSLIWSNALVVIVDVLSVLVLASALHREGRTIRELLRPWGWADLGWGALMVVVLFVAFLVVSFAANLAVYHDAPPLGTAPEVPLLVGIVAIVIAPATIAVAEELIYRGYAQPRLGARWGRTAGLLVVAVVFGVQHIGFVLDDPRALLAKIITTALLGLVLGGAMMLLRRVAPLVIGHWVLDLFGLGLPTLILALH